MLKRIDPADVTLGMFIHKLEGNWFSHPFWRARFLLTDPRRLARLHASRVPGVIIDTDRGLDLAVPEAAPPPAPAQRAPAAPVRQRLPDPPAPPPPPLAMPSPVARTLHAASGDTVRAFGRASAAADRGLKVVADVFLQLRLGKGIAAASVTPVIDSIMASMQSNPFAFNGLMRFRRDSEAVYRHALATSALMIALGRSLGLPPLDLHAAGLAGLLLDAGISLLPVGDDDTPFDPARLPTEVWHSHVGLGEDFIRRSRLSDAIARACLEHHERIDGTGWPNRTGGTELSRLGRMAAICDAYDWLVSPANGRDGLDPAAALRAMRDDLGAFDPDMLDAFAATLGIWPIGSLVSLRSGRLAVVIDQNRDALDRPLIAVFYAPASGQPIDDVWIDLNTCYGADAIAGPVTIDTLPPSQHAAATAALEAVIAQVAGTPTKKPARPRKSKARAA